MGNRTGPLSQAHLIEFNVGLFYSQLYSSLNHQSALFTMGAKKKADNKSKDKDAGGKGKDDKKDTKVKGAQAVIVRHILVSWGFDLS